jgi:FkbM family methyltransferase
MLAPNLFRFLFKFNFFRKRYFGIYKKIIQPKRLFKNKTTIAKYDSTLKIKLNLEEWIQQQIFLFDYFDQEGIDCVKKNLKNGDVFLDVGANIGAYALIASKIVGETGKVLCFEPVTSTFNHLKENVELNGLSNIQIEQKALMESPQNIEIHIGDISNTGTSSIVNKVENESKSEMIEAIVFDDQFKDLDRIDFIKMDIEGAEYSALKGMKNSIQKHLPKILIEISDDILKNATYTSKELIEFIINLGYEQFGINESGEKIPLSEQASNYHNFLFVPKEKKG